MTRGDEFEVILEAVVRRLRESNNIELTQMEQHLLEYFLRRPNLTYLEIADDLRQRQIRNVKAGYLRNVGSKLRQTLSALTGINVEKRNLADQLRHWHSRFQIQESSNLVGQSESVARLLHHLKNDAYRVICVTGMPRIGKTDLMNTVISVLRRPNRSTDPTRYNFQWIEAQDVPTIKHLIETLLQRLHGSRQRVNSLEEAMAALINEFRRQPLLIILHDADILYAPQQTAGILPESNGYHRLLRQLINDPTLEGRLVWVSRVSPRQMELARSTYCRHQVSSLSAEQGNALLDHRNLLRNAREGRQRLIEFCGGNPGLLLKAAYRVQDSCREQISLFMADPLRFLGQEETEHWQREIMLLSEAEKILVIWFMLCPWSHEALTALVIPNMSEAQRVQAIGSLKKRGFLMEQDGQNHLHPPYFQYVVATWLVQTVSQKLLEKQDLASLRYPLTLPLAATWRRQWYRQYLLEPLAREIQGKHWNRATQRTLFAELLEMMQTQTDDRQPDYSYAIGGLLTLFVTLQLPFKGFTLNSVAIRHADLQTANLTQMQIINCQFYDTAFPVYLSGTLVAEMSADGQAIAIGDSEGRVGYWVRSGDSFRLDKYHHFRSLPDKSIAIQAISVDQRDVLVVAVDQSIYRWWTSSNTLPSPQMEVESPVRCLAQRDDYIAAGLQDGSIKFYDRTLNVDKYCNAHAGAVNFLAFDAEGFELTSVVNSNRALRWSLMTKPLPVIQDTLSSEGRILWAVRWRDEHLILAGTMDGRPAIKQGEASWRNLSNGEDIDKLVFSRTGHFLAGIDGEGVLYLWDQTFQMVHQVALPESRPEKIGISDDGLTLLTVIPQHRDNQMNICIQIWDIQTGRLIWQMTASNQYISGLVLENIEGLSPAESSHLREFSN